MTRYTLGFVLAREKNKRRVILIKKKHGIGGQAGKWNGIGGEIEEGEGALDCMVRECNEELGLFIPPEEWTCYAALQGKDHHVRIYWTELPDEVEDYSPGSPFKFQGQEDAKFFVVASLLLEPDLFNDVAWLVPLAYEKKREFTSSKTADWAGKVPP